MKKYSLKKPKTFFLIGLGLALIAFNLSAQTPTVSLSLDKTSISEAGGIEMDK